VSSRALGTHNFIKPDSLPNKITGEIIVVYDIVVLPGDGIAREVIPEARKVLEAAEEAIAGLKINFKEFECGFEYYKKTGKPWSADAYSAVMESDAILFGAVGLPGVEGLEHIVYIHRILRRDLDLYANVRPVKLREDISSPLVGKNSGDINFVVVREGTEGLYTQMRGSLKRYKVKEVATDIKIATREGSRKVIKYAFDLCAHRGKGAPLDGKLRLTCVDKSTVLSSCALFREVFSEIGATYPTIEKDYALVDAFMQWLIRKPEYYNVVVTTNLFGDIITDLTAVFQGGLGMTPSAEIGDKYGMFRPTHGTAPRHYGKQEANPIAAILAAQLLMEYLAGKNEDKSAKKAADRIDVAVDMTLKEGKVKTFDLGGTSKTYMIGEEIAKKVLEIDM
jgi:3-isopropylmalate dehydrogenase